MSCGVSLRCGSDLAWLWLWHRPAAAVPIRHLAWELPYAVSAALKRQKTKKQKQTNKKKDEDILELDGPQANTAGACYRETCEGKTPPRRMPLAMKAEMGGLQLQAREGQRLPENHQKLERGKEGFPHGF